jgi:hypothetical protein
MAAGNSDFLMALMVVSAWTMGKAAAALGTAPETALSSSLEESPFLGLLLFLGNRIRRSL